MNNWLYIPNNKTISSVSRYTSSLGYFWGRDRWVDSSWFSYVSILQSGFYSPKSPFFHPLSPLLSLFDASHEKRGLSQPPQTWENRSDTGRLTKHTEELTCERPKNGKIPGRSYPTITIHRFQMN